MTRAVHAKTSASSSNEPVVSSAERTKASILKAATEEFGEHGLAGARVDRIARRAGVNKQALYYHYGDKDSLFQAALAAGYETSFQLQEIDWLNDPRSPTELMKYIVSVFFDMVRDNRNHIGLIADENRNKGKHLDDDVVRRIRKATARTVEAIRIVLRRGQDAGEFDRKIDPRDLYLFIISHPIFYFNHTYTLSGILQRDTAKPAVSAAHRDSFVRFVLAALRPS